MDNKEADTTEKIILPKNLQREMIKFFLRTSMPKLAKTEEKQQQSLENSNEGC